MPHGATPQTVDALTREILLIDPVDQNREAMTQLLEEQLQNLLGDRMYEIRDARDGAAGMELAMREHPDLIITELSLPVIDGAEMITHIKRDFPTIPIVAATTHSMTTNESGLENGGCDAYLKRPVSEADLSRTLRHFLIPKRVLILDNPANVSELEKSLTSIQMVFRHETVAPSSGREALEMISVSTPDLILLSAELDGFETCRKLKLQEHIRSVPVIILTGRNAVEDRIDGHSVGAHQVLVSPTNMHELRAVVVNLLNLRFLANT